MNIANDGGMGSSNSKLYKVAEETVGGAFFIFGGGTMATVLATLCAILIARLLGPELYGIYSLALIVPNFLLLFTDYGVSQALTKFIAERRTCMEENQITQLVKTSLSFTLATSITILLVGLIFLKQFTNLLTNRSEITHLVAVSIFIVVVQPISMAVSYALLGLGDMKGYALIDVIRQTFRVVLSPLLIVVGLSVLGAILGYVVAFAVGAVVAIMLFYRHYRRLRSQNENGKENPAKVNWLKPMVSYGLPLYTSSALQSFIVTFRGVLLAYFTTNFVIGNFNTAMNFMVPIALLSSPVATALFPAFLRLSGNTEEVKMMFSHSVKYTAALIIPVAIYMAIMSRDFVFLIYGPRYTLSPLYLTLYALTFLYTGLGSTVLWSFFSGIGDTRINLNSTLIYMVFFIPSATALTWAFGAKGLLASIIASTGTSVFYSLRVAIKKYGVQVNFKNSARIYAAAFSSAIPIILLALYSQLHWIINIIVSAILYGTAYLTILPMFKVLTEDDLKNLEKMFAKITFLQFLVKLIVNYENKLLKIFRSKSNS